MAVRRCVLRIFTDFTEEFAPDFDPRNPKDLDYVLPSQVRKRKQLSLNPQGKDAFSILDTNARLIAQRINKSPMGETLKGALQEWWGGVFNGIDQTPAELRNELFFHYMSTGPLDGHRGYFAGSVPIKNAGELFKTEAVLRHMIKSFPQGGLIVDPTWMEKAAKSENKAEFIRSNAADIKAAADKYFAEGGKLTNCGALLGSNNLVEVKGVVDQKIEGRTVQTMVVATTDQHPLDGINLWEAVHDPAHPDAVMFSNKLIGKHKLTYIMDWANNVLGQRLMTTAWATVPLSVEAEAAGVPLEQYIADRVAAGDAQVDMIDRSRWVLKGLDSQAMIPDKIQEYLSSHLPVVPVQVSDKPFSIIIDALKDGPAALDLIDKLRSLKENTPTSQIDAMHLKVENAAAGFFINKSAVDPAVLMNFNATTNANDNIPTNLHSTALEAVLNPAQQLLDASTLAKIHASATKVNKPLINFELKHDPSGSAKLMRSLRSNTPWSILMEQFLLRDITPDLVAEAFGKLRQVPEWSGAPDELLEKAVAEAVRETICSPLLAPEGYMETCTYLDMPELFKSFAPTSKQVLDQCDQAIAQAQVEVKSREDQLALVEKSSAEFVEKMREIKELDTKIADLNKQKDGIKDLSQEAMAGEQGFQKKEVELKKMESKPAEILKHGR